jgi:hypothetical protein
MKKLILPVLAALLPFTVLSAASDRYEVAGVTNEFAIAYTVAFGAEQKPESVVYYHYSLAPDAPESKWFKSRVFVNFAGDSAECRIDWSNGLPDDTGGKVLRFELRNLCRKSGNLAVLPGRFERVNLVVES